MNWHIVVGVVILVALAYETYHLDVQDRAAKRKRKELEADWNLRRAIQRGRQSWPKA